MARFASMSTTQETMTIGTPLYTNNGPVELLPNPDFVFPLPASSPSITDPVPVANRRPHSLQPPATARRGFSHNRGKSANLLPTFSFNPAGDTATVSAATTPLASIPTTPTSPSCMNISHRRGGSEFIGGDGRAGLGLMSTSPTKGDGILPTPIGGLKSGPPAGRRGHAHRRSGAISSHDLSSIMIPGHAHTPTNGGSAPPTPLESDPSSWDKSQINKAVSQPVPQSTSTDETSSPVDDPESSPRRPPSRARVGFSDRVEYIRPLSTISSETESSMSTIRGHSVTNSLSSIASTSAPSPPSRRHRPTLGASPESEAALVRPKTAGAVLDLKQGTFGFGGGLQGRKRPVSVLLPQSPDSPLSMTSPSPGTPKRRSFFHLSSKTLDNHELVTSCSDPSLPAVSLETPPASPTKDSANGLSEGDDEKIQAIKPKTSRKPRKVKSWANSIIRKSKPQSRLKDGSHDDIPPVPALPDFIPEMTPDFDADNTVTIVSPMEIETAQPRTQTDYATWKPKHIAPETDARSPIIDLDLAFGPFEAENRWGVSARGQRRALHSATFLNGLQQNHRRTESAPALVPFEARSTVIATNVMADVFEEEEPEEEASITSASERDVGEGINKQVGAVDAKEPMDEEDVRGVGIQLVESDMATGSAIKWNFDDGLRIQKPAIDEPSPVLETHSSLLPSLSRLPGNPNYGAVEVVEDHEEPRTSSLTHSSESTITPTELDPKQRHPQMNLLLPLPDPPLRTPDTFVTNSSFSSPNYNRSQSSLDTPRLGTAASSITDNRTLNSQFGEPGPELRMSVDDAPSLTSSSRSTGHFGTLQRESNSRAYSISSTHSSGSDQRRAKRSSIASLSRLIERSSGFGERSKLNIEQRPQSAHMDLKDKETKTKKTPIRRLSRYMTHLWRAKDAPQFMKP
ncbi:hypothetical protein EJ05DRAFT_501163 [Pseudovirgaria hyperparasitica]|uniref:Cell wall proline rich protein n=1 Tax=Pseudovirgaria hyperparasitica TaxID=470096 RepID=A0A6A6W506_9PEZI|nr:uncharacterized protein EJ05DRAFT_501163 [Pseudovirgaria hyperparasitica]KAF2757635.1 hypothetical protein EJ05DRAFT_501163 [Pseudovirgaria hyperparasitica]